MLGEVSGCVVCDGVRAPVGVAAVASLIQSFEAGANDLQVSYRYGELLRAGVLSDLHSEVGLMVAGGASEREVNDFVAGTVLRFLSSDVEAEPVAVTYNDSWGLAGEPVPADDGADVQDYWVDRDDEHVDPPTSWDNDPF